MPTFVLKMPPAQSWKDEREEFAKLLRDLWTFSQNFCLSNFLLHTPAEVWRNCAEMINCGRFEPHALFRKRCIEKYEFSFPGKCKNTILNRCVVCLKKEKAPFFLYSPLLKIRICAPSCEFLQGLLEWSKNIFNQGIRPRLSNMLYFYYFVS